MTNFTHKVLYTGVTNNLVRRIYEHINKVVASGFTSKYNVNKLVYFESYDSPMDAISREKQIKAGSRKKKNDLIEKSNPQYNDLYDTIV